MIKLKYNPPYTNGKEKLINNVCDYINSLINSKVNTNYVINDLKIIDNKVSELTFQIK